MFWIAEPNVCVNDSGRSKLQELRRYDVDDRLQGSVSSGPSQ